MRHHLRSLRRVGCFSRAAALIVALAALVGCAGQLPRKDGRVSQDSTVVDSTRWPDTLKPIPDRWPAPSDAYSPAPFGCLVDADCFGQRCCPTPWGTHLCALSCGR